MINPASANAIWWPICGIYLAAVARLLAKTDTSLRDFCYAAAAAAIAYCVFLVLFLRPGVAALCVFLTAVGFIHLSSLRFARTGSNLHAYDFAYFLSDLPAVGYWLKTDRDTAVSLFPKVATLVLLPIMMGWREPPMSDRWPSALCLVLAIIAFVIARCFVKPWHYWERFGRPVHFAQLLQTVFEAIEASRGGGVLAVTNEIDLLPARVEGPATLKQMLGPSIILILNESTFAPWVYDRNEPEPAFDEFFRSDDGRMHGLRADVFGGPTWATEFSILTGVPSSCYGPFASHIYKWAQNRINHSLPKYLKNCGYSTGLIYPSDKEFIRSDRFYESLGFDEIRDKGMLGAKSDREPDSFYFDHAISWLKSHDAHHANPLFLYIMTSSNHYPHTRPLIEREGALILGNTAAPEGEWDEYLLRLRRSCRDYRELRNQLKKSFPSRKFLIAHFGDHQPYFTRLPFKDEWRGWPQDCLPKQETAYQTYFSVQGLNFEPKLETTLPKTIEAAYMSTVLLAAAGIPLDEIFQVRQELMKRHNGKLFFAGDPAKHGMIAAQLNGLMIKRGHIVPH